MQKYILLVITVITSLATGGIPSGYYDDATGKSGNELKAALHKIVSNHTKYPYTSTSTDVWDLLKITDEDPNDTSKVILLYTGRSQDKDYLDHGASWDYTQYDGGNGTYGEAWNREHVWAKSHGFPDDSDTAYTDIHHLRPADRTVNSSRNNKEFDEGGVADDEATGCYYDNDAWTWEPRDAVKGDVARMMFYMVVRYDPGYHSDNSTYDLELVDSTGNASDSPLFGKLSTLLTWHNDDPVDSWEQTRNDTIYILQGNRNPFIDHPEYADSLWGSSTTTVYFSASGASQNENTGSYNLTVSISNMDGTNATSVQVAITGGSGSAADVNNYTTQTVTFPAGSAADQTVSLTITDDSDYEGDETITFSLQNVSGGNSAAIDYPSQFTLTLNDNDTPELYISEVSEGDGYTTEFLELYNSTSTAIDLTGYKIVMASASTNASESVFDIGSDGGGGDTSIPAGGFWIISRGANRTTFETAFSSFPSSAKFYDGNTGLYFATSTARRWRLRAADGTANTDDGTLIDDTGAAAGGEDQHTIQNPAGTFTTSTSTDGANSTPGALDNDQSLAVELFYFKAIPGGNKVILNWATASETNNLGYIIYRRTGGEPFQNIADYRTAPELTGQGSTTCQTNYSFTDKNVSTGHTYQYRLADVDYSGLKTYHGPVTVTVNTPGLVLARSYPNPFNPVTNISFTLGEPGPVRMTIYDIRGQLVCQLHDKRMDAGSHNIVWRGINDNRKQVASGIYFLRVQNRHNTYCEKLILAR